MIQEDQNLPPPPTVGKIFEAMVSFFHAENWIFYQTEEVALLQLAFQGENAQWTCYANARDEHQQFIFYSVCPVDIPQSKQLAIAEFITRANSGLVVGNFELNFANGEIRYKTSIDVGTDTLNSVLIQRLVLTNVLMMDHYLPGIMSLICSEVSPQEAISQVEK